MLLLRDMLYRNATFFGEDRAVAFYEGAAMTWQELDQESNRFANSLLNLGVKRGDRVAVLLYNGLEFVVAYWAAIKIGAIFMPINFWYKDQEIIHVVNDSVSSTLIFPSDFAEMIAGIKREMGSVVNYIMVGDNLPEPGMLSFRQILDLASPQRPEIYIEENDPHLILYTSGTTGLPKGAVHSQRAFFLHAGAMADACGMEEGGLFMNVYPMFHLAGPAFTLATTYKRSSLLIVGTPPTSEKILKAIQKYHVTSFLAVPTIWARLLAHPDFDQYDLSSLKFTMGASDAMPRELLEQIISRTRAACPQMYGLSEGGVLTYLNARDQLRKLGSCGKPHIQTDLRLVDDEGMDVGPGEPGEVICRSEHQMLYYWNNPEETSRTLRNGWLFTGDLGKFDEEGYLYIVGRKKDMILSGGQNIYPAEIEKVLLTLTKVAEVAVIGILDAQWGESVMAVVVPVEGQQITEEEVIDYVRARMAGYNKPRYVRFLDALPRTAATGKVAKQELRQRLSQELNRIQFN